MNNTDVIVSVNTIDDIKNVTGNTKYVNISIDSYDENVINYFLENGSHYSYSDSISGNNGFIYATYDMFKKGEKIINNIIDNMPFNLNDIEKVRYLYVSLGKILSQDINTMDNKNEKISFSDISTINNIWGSILSGKTTSACVSKIFMYLCSRIGIKSELISSNINGNVGNKVYVNDTFLILDLYSDLYNVQGNFSTKYFDKYNDNVKLDEKIFYVNNNYTNNLIDEELKEIDYTDEMLLEKILRVLERYLDINSIGVVELSKLCKDIFDKYCPNYDIRISNLFLIENMGGREHFIVINYNDSFYSYNYNKKCFVSVDYNTIYNNIKNNKIGVYDNEKINFIDGRLVL